MVQFTYEDVISCNDTYFNVHVCFESHFMQTEVGLTFQIPWPTEDSHVEHAFLLFHNQLCGLRARPLPFGRIPVRTKEVESGKALHENCYAKAEGLHLCLPAAWGGARQSGAYHL